MYFLISTNIYIKKDSVIRLIKTENDTIIKLLNNISEDGRWNQE